MEENKTLLLDKFIRVEFGNRTFYLPCVPSNIEINDNNIMIDMADMDSYVIVDGIRCYYCIIYDKESDIIQTWLKDFVIDGLLSSQQHYFSFPLNVKEFPFSNRDFRIVIPKRDYSEITSVFLADNKNLDKRIVKFLTKYPKMFEQVNLHNWIALNDYLGLDDFEEDLLEDYLPKQITTLFRDEMIKKTS